MKKEPTRKEKLEIELDFLRTQRIVKDILNSNKEQEENYIEFDMDVNYLFKSDNKIEF